MQLIQNGEPLTSPAKALTFTRLCWVVLSLNIIGFATIALSILEPSVEAGRDYIPLLQIAMPVALCIATMMAYFFRSQIYKRHWQQNVVTPSGYLTGNIVLFFVLDFIAIANLALVGFISREIAFLIYAAIALAIMILNFPTGKPMQPSLPRVG